MSQVQRTRRTAIGYPGTEAITLRTTMARESSQTRSKRMISLRSVSRNGHGRPYPVVYPEQWKPGVRAFLKAQCCQGTENAMYLAASMTFICTV